MQQKIGGRGQWEDEEEEEEDYMNNGVHVRSVGCDRGVSVDGSLCETRVCNCTYFADTLIDR